VPNEVMPGSYLAPARNFDPLPIARNFDQPLGRDFDQELNFMMMNQ
jgi:hypothetical protein